MCCCCRCDFDVVVTNVMCVDVVVALDVFVVFDVVAAFAVIDVVAVITFGVGADVIAIVSLAIVFIS